MFRMKALVVADIHGDIAALEAALTAGRAQDAERLVCLGDVVDAFLPGRKNTACVMKLIQEKPWVWVRGNHDVWLASASRSSKDPDYRPTIPFHLAVELAARPKIVHELGATFVHASVMDPDGISGVVPPGDDEHRGFERLRALSDAGTRLLFCGHTHVAFIEVFAPDGKSSEVFRLGSGPARLGGRKAVINPGRLGSSGGTVAAPVVLRDPKGNKVEWRPPEHHSSHAIWDTELDTIEILGL